MLKTTHSCGFFSCCNVRLDNIINFINKNQSLPTCIDSSEQFGWYKENNNQDITYGYFEHYDNIKNIEITFPIQYSEGYQFSNYNNLDYNKITPVINKYFHPSTEIFEIINNIEIKYNLNYKNICVLFYRGNDKNRETKKCNYSEYLTYANEILKLNSSIIFLIQSDETEFIESMTKHFSNNSIYFKDEIRHMNKCDDTVDIKMKLKIYDFSKKYLAITIIMSKCKYIICGSGNCDQFIMFYRTNNINVIQNLNGKWINNLI